MTKKEQEQQTLVHGGNILPITYVTKYQGYDVKAILESFGTRFYDVLTEDSSLQFVGLPPGWESIKVVDPILWLKLLDEKGRERGKVFLNAASPQRLPSLFLNTRFDVVYDFQRAESGWVVVHVTEGNDVIYTPRAIKIQRYADSSARQSILDNAWERGFKWFKRHGYSDWRNPAAYWD